MVTSYQRLSGFVKLKGFYDKGNLLPVQMYLKDFNISKVGKNLWYCEVSLKPITKDIHPKILVMRLSKRMIIEFATRFKLIVEVDKFRVDSDCNIYVSGYLNKQYTKWQHVIFDRERSNNNNDGDVE